MEKKLKVYEVGYVSAMFRCENYQTTNIYSDKELKKGDFIIVEHIDCGLFIGKVLMDNSDCDFEDCSDSEIKEAIRYKYVQDIDLSNYFAEKEKQKRKEELKAEMEKKFAEIDKEQKYQYYADLDYSFRAIYEEYKNL